MSNFIFPKNLIIGFQNRSDTYTGKLGFINFYHPNGEINKAGTFNKWSDQGIEKLNVMNKPISGFVINKNIRRDSSFANSNKIRIYHPEGFEFEISIENLIALTNETNIISQEIQGECVLVWSSNANNVYLLPASSIVYQELINVVETKPFDQKEKLKEGYIYSSKKYPELVYIGKNVFYNKTNGGFNNLAKKAIMAISEKSVDEEYIKLIKDLNNFYEYTQDSNNIKVRTINKEILNSMIDDFVANLEGDEHYLSSVLYSLTDFVNNEFKKYSSLSKDKYLYITRCYEKGDGYNYNNKFTNKESLKEVLKDHIFQYSVIEYNDIFFIQSYTGFKIEDCETIEDFIKTNYCLVKMDENNKVMYYK